eukprot:gb/GECG01005093.1/.p1 GENE.gb/GECG01005093.1/~~gb/GECG01005093.1/.p1  ORF type:complete len:817 (+),score=110.55 gb/GECG01005093.1/:1-2451(+)
MGRFREALACFNAALNIESERSDVYTAKGRALSSRNKEHAISCYEEAIRIDQLNVDAYLYKGEDLADLGAIATAVSCFDDALRIQPTNTELLLQKGMVLQLVPDAQQALRCYDRVLVLDNDCRDAYVLKGLAIQQLKENKSVRECVEEAWTPEPCEHSRHQPIETMYNNGDHYNLEQAIECYKQSIQRDPASRQGYLLLGHLLLKTENGDEAMKCYEEGIQRIPNFTEAFYFIGEILRTHGKYQKALHWLHKVLRHDSTRFAAYYSKGRIYEEQRRWKNALDSYDSALKLRPDYVPAYVAKARTFEDLNKWKESLQCYNEALRRDPENPVLVLQKAVVFNRMRKLDLSFSECKKLHRLLAGHKQSRSSTHNVSRSSFSREMVGLLQRVRDIAQLEIKGLQLKEAQQANQLLRDIASFFRNMDSQRKVSSKDEAEYLRRLEQLEKDAVRRSEVSEAIHRNPFEKRKAMLKKDVFADREKKEYFYGFIQTFNPVFNAAFMEMSGMLPTKQSVPPGQIGCLRDYVGRVSQGVERFVNSVFPDAFRALSNVLLRPLNWYFEKREEEQRHNIGRLATGTDVMQEIARMVALSLASEGDIRVWEAEDQPHSLRERVAEAARRLKESFSATALTTDSVGARRGVKDASILLVLCRGGEVESYDTNEEQIAEMLNHVRRMHRNGNVRETEPEPVREESFDTQRFRFSPTVDSLKTITNRHYGGRSQNPFKRSPKWFSRKFLKKKSISRGLRRGRKHNPKLVTGREIREFLTKQPSLQALDTDDISYWFAHAQTPTTGNPVHGRTGPREAETDFEIDGDHVAVNS